MDCAQVRKQLRPCRTEAVDSGMSSLPSTKISLEDRNGILDQPSAGGVVRERLSTQKRPYVREGFLDDPTFGDIMHRWWPSNSN